MVHEIDAGTTRVAFHVHEDIDAAGTDQVCRRLVVEIADVDEVGIASAEFEIGRRQIGVGVAE